MNHRKALITINIHAFFGGEGFLMTGFAMIVRSHALKKVLFRPIINIGGTKIYPYRVLHHGASVVS